MGCSYIRSKLFELFVLWKRASISALYTYILYIYDIMCLDETNIFKLTRSCRKKCILPKYHEEELSKGEAICLDRCVSKFMDVQERAGKKLTAMFTQEQATMMGQK